MDKLFLKKEEKRTGSASLFRSLPKLITVVTFFNPESFFLKRDMLPLPLSCDLPFIVPLTYSSALITLLVMLVTFMKRLWSRGDVVHVDSHTQDMNTLLLYKIHV